MSANVFNPSEFKKQNRLRGLVHIIKVDLSLIKVDPYGWLRKCCSRYRWRWTLFFRTKL